jgi:hypothetical protein
MKKSLYCFLLTAGLVACSGNTDNQEKDILSDTTQQTTVKINREVLNEMIRTLPQPIEIANIITKSKMDFSKDILVPSDNALGYADKYRQAIAFGAYGVDLGYINLNEKTLYTLDYLESIKDLSKELKVDQFFDFSTLAELSSNRDNADSLVQISTRNFNRIDEFLREQNRGELSVLILIGAWIEGMHMFGEIHKNNADINTRIGEQKIVFDNSYALIDKLTEIPEFKTLKEDMAGLKAAYDSVTISTIYRQPETKEINGELVVIDNSETKVEISEQNVTDIISNIEKIRSKYMLTIKK